MDLQQLNGLIGNFCGGMLATVDESGYPDLRGWEFQFVLNGKPYFTTSNLKSVYRQLSINPKAAFCCASNGYTVRISGDVRFESDPAIIRRVFETMDEGVKSLYPTIESDGFTVLCFARGTVRYAKDGAAFERFDF